MPKQNIQYPNVPWPVANLRRHPRFEALLAIKTSHKDHFLRNAMVETLGKFEQGCTWNEFLASQPGRPIEIMEQLAEELVRMRVYVMDYSKGEARMIPATEVAASESERITKKMVSYYLPVEIIEKVTATADKRFQSASAVVHMALEAFLGAA